MDRRKRSLTGRNVGPERARHQRTETVALAELVDGCWESVRRWMGR